MRSDQTIVTAVSRWGRRLSRHKGGSMLLEFALGLPVLAMIVVGMSDVGRFALDKSTLLQAARAGAQYGISASQASAGAATALSPAELSNVDATALASTSLTGVTVSHTYFCECTSGVSVVNCSPKPSCAALKYYVTVTASRPFASIMSSGGVTFSFGTWKAPTQVSASTTTILP